jgi:glycosyltransferase involved in cell wall biosynthesis
MTDPAPMRVILVVTQREMGGAQSVALRIAAGLRERGHDAETWFLYRKHPAYEDEPRTRVVYAARPSTPLGLLGIYRQLLRDFRHRPPDAVIGFTYYANAIALSAATNAGVERRIATQHNPAWSYPRLGRWMDARAGSRRMYTANAAVSEAVAATFSDYPGAYRENMIVIPNGIDPPVPHRDRPAVRAHFGLPADAPLVLNAGRLVAQKNQMTLVDAMALRHDVHVAIAGDGELRADLVSRAMRLGVRDRLHLLGVVAPQDVADLMFAADIFAMPSIHEGMSLTMLEALAAGMPIVASKIPAQSELLDPVGQDPVGLLHDPRDAAALAEFLGRVIDDADLRALLRAASLARASDFSVDRMIDRYAALLRDPISASAP